MGDKMDRERYNRLRERTDKISSLMGQYLLKGYRMLGTCCDTCGTVLLKFRDEPDYCVGCNEVDADTTTKPQSASRNAVDHSEQSCQVATNTNGYSIIQEETSRDQAPRVPSSSESVSTAVTNLNDKIVTTSEALRNCFSVEESIRYCELLKSCAEALKALHEVQGK
ncbi:protein ZNRD2-like [Actinia tenebrosa]|uniref:Protein ZNRD2-like n=1 Tax=Actinia tenebrosa TaxID=6105 RepID=A0A6P8I0G7_ACTTE|nr:protein ZNRD2-like [Actinia tenebrosa]